MPLKQTEQQLQHACLELLQLHENTGRLLFIRNNSFAGAIVRRGRDGAESKGYIKNNKPGAPDIIIFFRNGMVINVELKSLIGKLSREQAQWASNATKLGYRYCIIKSVEELERMIIDFL